MLTYTSVKYTLTRRNRLVSENMMERNIYIYRPKKNAVTGG